MKFIRLSILFFGLPFFSKAQYDCGPRLQQNSLRPDTIREYQFVGKSIDISKMPGSKPLSAHGFKTKKFIFRWMPVYTENTKEFADRSLGKHDIIDSLKCKFFDKEYNAAVIKDGKKISLFIYSSNTGSQDVFIMQIRGDAKKIKDAIAYLERNLR